MRRPFGFDDQHGGADLQQRVDDALMRILSATRFNRTERADAELDLRGGFPANQSRNDDRRIVRYIPFTPVAMTSSLDHCGDGWLATPIKGTLNVSTSNRAVEG